MLSFVACVHAPPGQEAASPPEAPAVQQIADGATSTLDRDSAPTSSDSDTGAPTRGRLLPLRLLPRRQQPRAEQAKGRAVSAREEEPSDTANHESVQLATEEGAQGAAGEGALRGTLYAIAQAGGYAGALVLEALQGVGSLQMGPMGTLPMASFSTKVSDVKVPSSVTSPQASNSKCDANAGVVAGGQCTDCEGTAEGTSGLRSFDGVPGKGKGKQRVPLVPLSTVAEEPADVELVEAVLEGGLGLPKRRKSMDIFRSISHKVGGMALAVA